MDMKGLENFTNSWWPVVISFIISIVGAIRFYAGGTKCPNDDRMNGKVVVITGGSSGIGLRVAKELAERGAQVIIGCRNEQNGMKAIADINSTNKAAKVEVRSLDVSKLSSIRQFTQEIAKDYGKIDVLINNAGIIFHQHQVTEENHELTFATNYLGPFLLTHLLLPLLDKARNGRIINIGATAHKLATLSLDNLNFSREFLYRSAFGQTKLAIVLFTKHMGNLLKLADKKNITINAVNPGLVRGTNHMRMSPLGNSWMTRMSTLPWTWLFLKSPKQGAQSIIYVATDRKFEYTTGEYISDCEIDAANEMVKDKEFLAELYEKSCDLCGISPFTKSDL